MEPPMSVLWYLGYFGGGLTVVWPDLLLLLPTVPTDVDAVTEQQQQEAHREPKQVTSNSTHE